MCEFFKNVWIFLEKSQKIHALIVIAILAKASRGKSTTHTVRKPPPLRRGFGGGYCQRQRLNLKDNASKFVIARLGDYQVVAIQNSHSESKKFSQKAWILSKFKSKNKVLNLQDTFAHEQILIAWGRFSLGSKCLALLRYACNCKQKRFAVGICQNALRAIVAISAF